MKRIAILSALVVLAACDSAPSEESPVAPKVVCVEPDLTNGEDQGTAPAMKCEQYEEAVDNEAAADGNVVIDAEEASAMTNAS